MRYADSLTRLRRALSFARPFRFTVVLIIGLTLVGAALNAIEPLVLKYLFDRLGERGSIHPLVYGVLGLTLLSLAREGSGALSNRLTWRTRVGVNYALLGATVDRLQHLSLAFHRNERVGGIMTRLDRGIQGFLGAICEIAFNVLPALIYLCISVFVMVRLDWRLAVVVLFFAPAPILIAALAAPEQTRRERTLLDQWTKIYSRFNEVLSGIVTVKSFAMEKRETGRFLGDVEAANRVVVNGVKRDSGTGAAQSLVVALARMASIGVGGLLVLKGEVTLGTLVAFLGYVGGLFGPVQGLSSVYKTLHTASVSLDTIFSIMDAEDHMGDAPDAIEMGPVKGEVRFENVRFSYGPSRKPVLDGIDVKVQPGETVALVGPSGAGKTTMMSLLERFYDPLSGVVRVDGIDLRGVRQNSLRRQIGVVLQDNLLFNDTVIDNIRYGKRDASPSEVVRAAKAANAHEFIMRLQDGYETMVGERGNLFSAGERQRVAIARAILKAPPILILDEPTSALDAETEALVQEALARLAKGRTTFIIAHRLSTIVAADRILVLKDGRIIEEGTHAKLISLNGYYASLVRQQTLGLFLEEEKALRASSKRKPKVSLAGVRP